MNKIVVVAVVAVVLAAVAFGFAPRAGAKREVAPSDTLYLPAAPDDAVVTVEFRRCNGRWVESSRWTARPLEVRHHFTSPSAVMRMTADGHMVW